MIAIVNVSEHPAPTGVHEYELRINRRVIATFQHVREDGLEACLMQAAAAARRAKELEELHYLELLTLLEVRK